ncbi:SusC/RagA family TonB-linked outer membrane protein [Mucilaginibacter ginkgonis]|uniref:SusC/RagA family TonB-linked outer membrane protein n=1 Tax=Mucilaginibacter ginkgonis TaxID=2682091 RepID=A0A6I4HZU5_9SPHI|nr:SusC/RagA family TonB-linked outer membrane protein [Mucilaginibacter ginkgonis]QQL49893.1 SusC/RagA family TonB-linked outer membrane protein [Mucilaginibacter ginkgonis]
MKKKILLSVMAALCLFYQVLAQPKAQQNKIILSGIVTDDSGLPLPGASVNYYPEQLTAITNKDGTFHLTVSQTRGRLTFSFTGFQKLELPAERFSNTNVKVTMKPSQSTLDEVQVIAYGKTTKRFNTGDVSTVTAATIETQPVSNPLAALEGRVPGLIISQNSGVAGSSFKVQIRGQSALDLGLSKNDPLFIVDGVPFESGNTSSNQINSAANNPTSISSGGLSPLNSISPSDIESIEVLKDADATAIYGSRGANGVILITTKKGKAGADKISFSVNTGFSKVGRKLPLLNTSQYLQVRKEGFANDGLTPNSTPGDPGFAPDITLWDNNRYTDFQKLLIGGTAHSTDARGTVSGGNVNTQFLVGGGYHRETTVYSSDFSDAVASAHFSITHASENKRFTLLFTGLFSNDNNRLPRYDLTRYINLPPNLNLYDASGKLAWQDQNVLYSSLGNGDIINPLSLLQDKYRSVNENLNGNLQLGYKILPGLTLRSSFGYNSFRTDERSMRPTAAIDPNSGELPSAAFASSQNKNWIIEPQLEYNMINGAHKLNVLVGNTYQDRSADSYAQQGNNYNSDLLLNSIAAASQITAVNDHSPYRYTALFGRVNYNLADKYLLNLSARRDGSSRFAPDKRMANFGAIGAAWIFSGENFFQKAIPFLSFGKLRSSYGQTGNDQIGEYKYLNLWTNTAIPYGGIPGLIPRTLYNPDYSWEVNKKFEAAIELGFLKDNLLLSTAYYNNESSNQLISYNLPSQTGFFSVTRNFPGKVRNTGWEILLTSKNFHSKEFSWTTTFNITVPKNKLIAFPDLATSSYASRYVIGQSLNLVNAYKYAGVDSQTGLYKVVDTNGDGQLNVADYQVSGNLDPKFYGGLQNSITWHSFDLGFFFEFRKQRGLNYLGQLSNTPPGWIYNQPDLVLNRWQQPGETGPVQRYTTGFTNALTAAAYLANSDGIYTDASFIRLKNVSLSYRIPEQIIRKYHLGSCRLFIEGQNLLTITNYQGSDPENMNFFVLPPLRTLVAGLQLNL